MCNTSEGVQVYLITPALKKHISVLASLREDGTPTHNLLYGVLVSREQGPDQYVNAEPVPVTAPSGGASAATTAPVAPVAPPTPPSKPSVASSNSSSATAAPVHSVAAAPAAPLAPVPVAAPVVPPPVRPQFVNPVSRPGVVNAFSAQQPAPAASALSAPAPARPAAPQPPAVQAPSAAAAAPVAAQQNHQQETIRKVAQFCATKGVQTLQTLKDKPESRALMPFLFEGGPGYADFMQALRLCVSQLASQSNVAASSTSNSGPPPPPPPPQQQQQQQQQQPDRMSRFGPTNNH